MFSLVIVFIVLMSSMAVHASFHIQLIKRLLYSSNHPPSVCVPSWFDQSSSDLFVIQ